MNEIRGLANLLATSGTIHLIEEPPEPRDFQSTEAFWKAHDDWYARTNYWRTTLSVTSRDPHSPEDAEPDGQWETSA